MVLVIKRLDKKIKGTEITTGIWLASIKWEWDDFGSGQFILQIMKMEQIKLFEEASSYKKCLADMNEMSSTIQSKSMFDLIGHKSYICIFLSVFLIFLFLFNSEASSQFI